jgi:hypothetical protein
MFSPPSSAGVAKNGGLIKTVVADEGGLNIDPARRFRIN